MKKSHLVIGFLAFTLTVVFPFLLISQGLVFYLIEKKENGLAMFLFGLMIYLVMDFNSKETQFEMLEELLENKKK